MKLKKSTVLRIRINEDLLDRLDILKGDKTLSGYVRGILERHAEGEKAAIDFEALRLQELVGSVERLNEAEKEIKATLHALRNSHIWNRGLIKDLLFYVARMNFYMDELARLRLSQADFDALNRYVKERSERERKNIERLFE